MRTIVFLVLVLLPGYLTGDTIHEYAQDRIHSFEIGSGEGKIAYNPKRYEAAGPTAFTISHKYEFYICDPNNYYINIYNRNFTYNNSINDVQSGYASGAEKIIIDKSKNIIVLSGTTSLIKFDSTGNMLFKIWHDALTSEFKAGNFFAYHDKILYYDNNMNILFRDAQGNLMSKEDTDKEIVIMKENISKFASNNCRGISSLLLNKFFDKKMVGFKDGILLTASFKMHREYFEMLKREINTKSNIVFDDKFDMSSIKVKIRSNHFIDFDNNGNSYWKVELSKKPEDRAVLVCSKYGEALDCFYNRIMWSKIAVAPDGDVYFLDFDNKGTHLYKTTRHW